MNTSDPQYIREQMARIRHNLDEEVDSVVERAKELTDWRNFVRRHPLISVSAAAALGFVAVPRRLNVMSPDARTLERLAKQDRLVVKPKSEIRKQSGLLAPVMGLVATAILRNGMTMAGQHLGNFLAQQQSPQTEAQRPTGKK